MRRLLRLGVAGFACAGVLTCASFARAQDGGPDAGGDGGSTISPGAILAYYCGDAELQCTIAPIEFEHTHDLAPWLPDWDTGWIPQNFDELQVRFAIQFAADTIIRMGGKFRTTWPQPLTVATPGDRFSGFLSFDYGVDVIAQGKIDISLLGYHITWQGNLPYVPNVAFHLKGMEQFDAWAFQPNPVSSSAVTQSINLFKINVLGLAGVPSQIAEGGVELNIKGELKATYYTERMVVETSVVDITTENGETEHNFAGGGFVELDVHPEGKLDYDGIIHLIPAFYVEVLGSHIAIPFYDYPLNITDLLNLDLASDIVFDTVRVHVPLPDIPEFEEKVLDFGKVPTGSGTKISVPIPNEGEAKARAVGEVEDSMAQVFKMLSPSTFIDPGASEDMVVRFTPKKAGKYETTLTIRSNDPDLPTQTVVLRGEAVGEDIPEYPGEDAAVTPGKDGAADDPIFGNPYESGDDGGCGCRTAGKRGDTPAPLWLGLVGLAALGLARRRSTNVADRKRN